MPLYCVKYSEFVTSGTNSNAAVQILQCSSPLSIILVTVVN